MQVGFIGLGRMGQAIAGNVLKGGHDLIVYNRTRAKASELEAAGAAVAASIAAACEGREVVMSMRTDGAA
jgi:3-hydroxyisobutyrate dehydrogenase-like beta-hydroxyacid dehydrogenase